MGSHLSAWSMHKGSNRNKASTRDNSKDRDNNKLMSNKRKRMRLMSLKKKIIIKCLESKSKPQMQRLKRLSRRLLSSIILTRIWKTQKVLKQSSKSLQMLTKSCRILIKEESTTSKAQKEFERMNKEVDREVHKWIWMTFLPRSLVVVREEVVVEVAAASISISVVQAVVAISSNREKKKFQISLKTQM